MPDPTIPRTAQQVTDGALLALSQGDDVVIAAHAGAGKTGGQSSGTIRMAAALARTGMRVALLVAQNDQVVETLARLTAVWPDVTTTFLPASSSWGTMPDWIRLARQRPPNLAVATSGTPARQRLQRRPGLYVMTLSKFSFLAPFGVNGQQLQHVEPFDVVIVDEAWMAPSSLWLRLNPLARQLALVGDNGQIFPWLPDTEYYPGMLDSPVEPLPSIVARERGRVRDFVLPVSRRNPSHTTDLTGKLPAYAGTPTTPMYAAREVPTTLGAIPLQRDPLDAALQRMATDGLVLERVAAGVAPQNDTLVATACARTADRLLSLGAVLGHPDGDRRLTADDVAILVAHHDQKAAIQRALVTLGRIGPTAPTVATFNTIQARRRRSSSSGIHSPAVMTSTRSTPTLAGSPSVSPGTPTAASSSAGTASVTACSARRSATTSRATLATGDTRGWSPTSASGTPWPSSSRRQRQQPARGVALRPPAAA